MAALGEIVGPITPPNVVSGTPTYLGAMPGTAIMKVSPDGRALVDAASLESRLNAFEMALLNEVRLLRQAVCQSLGVLYIETPDARE